MKLTNRLWSSLCLNGFPILLARLFPILPNTPTRVRGRDNHHKLMNHFKMFVLGLTVLFHRRTPKVWVRSPMFGLLRTEIVWFAAMSSRTFQRGRLWRGTAQEYIITLEEWNSKRSKTNVTVLWFQNCSRNYSIYKAWQTNFHLCCFFFILRCFPKNRQNRKNKNHFVVIIVLVPRQNFSHLCFKASNKNQTNQKKGKKIISLLFHCCNYTKNHSFEHVHKHFCIQQILITKSYKKMWLFTRQRLTIIILFLYFNLNERWKIIIK